MDTLLSPVQMTMLHRKMLVCCIATWHAPKATQKYLHGRWHTHREFYVKFGRPSLSCREAGGYVVLREYKSHDSFEDLCTTYFGNDGKWRELAIGQPDTQIRYRFDLTQRLPVDFPMTEQQKTMLAACKKTADTWPDDRVTYIQGEKVLGAIMGTQRQGQPQPKINASELCFAECTAYPVCELHFDNEGKPKTFFDKLTGQRFSPVR